MRYKIIPLVVALFFICGCGPSSEFNRAQQLETDGYFVQSAIKYEGIFKKYPDKPMAPEALYRAGRIYQKQLKLYSKAGILFTKLREFYSAVEPWGGLAEDALFACPEYFPLGDGNFWIEGDSRTGGENMRAEWSCVASSGTVYRVNKRILAGRSLVAQVNRYYRVQNLELRESVDNLFKQYTVVLTYPFEPGRSWTTSRDGRAIKCRIIDRNAEVKVVAGDFTNCLKISEEYPNLQGAIKFNYYAPGVGWVMTSTASLGGTEYRSSELLSYRLRPLDTRAKNLAAGPTENKADKKHKAGKK